MSPHSTRNEYTEHERLIIIQFIIDEKAYLRLRGNSIWQKLERSGLIKRSWQSLKQHFKIHIITNITTFKIPEEEKTKISNGYHSTAAQKKTKKKKTVRVPSRKSKLNFSDEVDSSDVELDKRQSAVLSSVKDIVVPSGSKSFQKQKTAPQKRLPSTSMASCSKTLDKQIENVLLEVENVENQSRSESILISISDTSNENENTQNIPESTSKISNCSNVTPCVSSNNLDETLIEFSYEEDENFLKFILKDEEYIKYVNNSILYKSYADLATKNRSWLELLDRFIDYILPHLILYNFLTPENITTLNNNRELIENFRNEIQRTNSTISVIEPENNNNNININIIAIKVNQSTQTSIKELPLLINKNINNNISFDHNSSNLNENHIKIVKSVGDTCDELHANFSGFLFDESSDFNISATVNEIQNVLDNNIRDEETTSPMITTEPVQISIKQEVLSEESQVQETMNVNNNNNIQIKQENTPVNNVSIETQPKDNLVQESQNSGSVQIKSESRIEESEDFSESIHIQPDIYMNLSQILDNTSVNNSQYLNSLNTQERNVINVVEEILDINNEEMDETYQTCFTQTQNE